MIPAFIENVCFVIFVGICLYCVYLVLREIF